MIIIKDIINAYVEVDSHLSLKETRARTPNSREKWAQRRDRNDQAYFMVIFARFENILTDLCEALVQRKQTSVRWADNRPWKTIDTRGNNIRRFPFLKRVSLLMDNTSSDYSTIARFYTVRNNIAHGSTVGPISVTTVATDFVRYLRAMKRNS